MEAPPTLEDPLVRMLALTSDALEALSGIGGGGEVRALLLLKQAAGLAKQIEGGDTWEAKAGLHTAFAEVYAWIGDAKDLERGQTRARGSFAPEGGVGEKGWGSGGRSPIDTGIDEEASSSGALEGLVSSAESDQENNTGAFESYKWGSRIVVGENHRGELGVRGYRGSLDSGMLKAEQEGKSVDVGTRERKHPHLVAPYQTAKWWYEKAKQELAKAYQLHAEANHSNPRASLSILVRTGDLLGRLGKDESAAACYVAAGAMSKQLGSGEAREVREEILHVARGLKTKCGRAVLASFTDSPQNPAGLKARALLCMREGRYKEAEVTYLRLLELMRDQRLEDADTLLLAKVMLQAILRGHSLRPFLHASDEDIALNRNQEQYASDREATELHRSATV